MAQKRQFIGNQQQRTPPLKCDNCGALCKNQHGLNVHKASKSCKSGKRKQQQDAQNLRAKLISNNKKHIDWHVANAFLRRGLVDEVGLTKECTRIIYIPNQGSSVYTEEEFWVDKWAYDLWFSYYKKGGRTYQFWNKLTKLSQLPPDRRRDEIDLLLLGSMDIK